MVSAMGLTKRKEGRTMRNREYCTIREEYDIDGRTVYVVADDQVAWTCYREDWDAAVAEYGDLDSVESYVEFCRRTGYLRHDAPEAHQKIIDMGADWNWA